MPHRVYSSSFTTYVSNVVIQPGGMLCDSERDLLAIAKFLIL